MPTPRPLRHLIVILGDQLDPNSEALADFDPKQDAVWMAEVAGEATHVWTSLPRLILFLSAMRHFRDACLARGWRVHYRSLTDPANRGTLAAELEASLLSLRPTLVRWLEPGEYRVEQDLTAAARAAGAVAQVLPDSHFFCTRADFARHARGRRQLRLEYFYREMRRAHRVLLTREGDPEGGEWNFDADNRGAFPREGPGRLVPPISFPPDAITQGVIADLATRFPQHPGRSDAFDWPVTPADAQAAWQDFLKNRLAHFGRFQDAMWTDQPWLYHARIAAALNLKLLSPRQVVQDVEAAFRKGQVDLPSAEGFIRQVLGWREYVRGLYWLHMPNYLELNALEAHEDLPSFYWTGQTEMACLAQSIGQTLKYGYAHHIQRLMVTGLFSLLVGVDPKQVHQWYLAVYVDAVEWVELPNTLGMSQYADGGIMASKPYVATGKYIQRMSNYCRGCPYDPAVATGPKACPFTTLYWDFLLRHRPRLAKNPRMSLQVKNLDKMSHADLRLIQESAQALRLRLKTGAPAAVPATTGRDTTPSLF